MSTCACNITISTQFIGLSGFLLAAQPSRELYVIQDTLPLTDQNRCTISLKTSVKILNASFFKSDKGSTVWKGFQLSISTNSRGYTYLRSDHTYLRSDHTYLRSDYTYSRSDYTYLRSDCTFQPQLYLKCVWLAKDGITLPIFVIIKVCKNYFYAKRTF